MQRTEQTGLGISLVGHVAIFAALSLGLFAATKPMIPPTQPIDIQIVDKVGLTDTAPEPPKVEPAQSVAPVVGPPEEAPTPEPAPVQREAVAPPKPAPTPKPAPKAVVKPSVKPAPSKPTVKPSVAPARGSKLGSDFLKGVSDRPSPSTSQAPRVVSVGPAQQAAIGRLIREQLKPHWKAPTGPDSEQLRTELRVRLAKDGTVISVEVIGTTGQTDSNRGQVRPHQEAAMKAVRLASPFVGLPAEYYSAWGVLETVGFDKRLSQ
jgi:outer membrane biosynthesis protein TonB